LSEVVPKLFVGVGNVLQHDDGVGVRAAEIMSHLPLPDDIEVYDAGTGSMDLPCILNGRELVIVVDALQANAPPGAVFRMSPDEIRPFVKTGFSLHDLHLLDALEELKLLGLAPRRVIIFGVQVDDVSSGLGLSEPVEAGLQLVLEKVCEELGLSSDILEQAPTGSAWLTYKRDTERVSSCKSH